MMKKLMIVVSGWMIMSGCAEKPALPKDKNHYPISRSAPAVELSSIPGRTLRSAVMDKSGNREYALSPSEIFETLSPAVFKVHTSAGYRGFQGSGFFISGTGMAVSNYHVFQGTLVGYENIILSDGSSYKITDVYYKSEENDFIIFQVGLDKQVRYVTMAADTPKVGEKVYAIGSPRGLDNTFSSGEISQIRNGGRILQINVPIDHGSSGGVLLNSRGEAVGITMGGFDDSGANLNFAININVLRSHIP